MVAREKVLNFLKANKYRLPHLYEGYRSLRFLVGEAAFPLRADRAYADLIENAHPRPEVTRYDTLSKPETIIIEINNTCNLNCRMCETQKSKRPKGEMPMPLFTATIDALAHLGYKSTKFTTINEPLFCSDFIARYRYAQEAGINVPLITNGTLLNTLMEGFKKANWYPKHFNIRISIDGIGDHYNYLRRGADFHQLTRGIRAFKHFCVTHRIQHSLSANFLVTPDNLEDLPRFYRMFKDCFHDNLHFGFINSNTPDRSNNPIFKDSLRNFSLPVIKPAPCFQPFYFMYVLANGDVSVCCRDYDGKELVIGNVKEEGLMEIWHGERARRIRQIHNSGNTSGLSVCNACFRQMDPMNAFTPYALYLLKRYPGKDNLIVTRLTDYLLHGTLKP